MGRSSWWRSSWAGALSAIIASWIQRNKVWVGYEHEIQTNPCCLGTGCQGLQCKHLGWWKSAYQRSTPMSSTSLAILSSLQVALFHFALLFSETMWCDFIFSVVGVGNADGWIIKAFKEAAEWLATQFVTNGVQTWLKNEKVLLFFKALRTCIHMWCSHQLWPSLNEAAGLPTAKGPWLGSMLI